MVQLLKQTIYITMLYYYLHAYTTDKVNYKTKFDMVLSKPPEIFTWLRVVEE